MTGERTWLLAHEQHLVLAAIYLLRAGPDLPFVEGEPSEVGGGWTISRRCRPRAIRDRRWTLRPCRCNGRRLVDPQRYEQITARHRPVRRLFYAKPLIEL